jgi:hypothetical protein
VVVLVITKVVVVVQGELYTIPLLLLLVVRLMGIRLVLGVVGVVEVDQVVMGVILFLTVPL